MVTEKRKLDVAQFHHRAAVLSGETYFIKYAKEALDQAQRNFDESFKAKKPSPKFLRRKPK